MNHAKASKSKISVEPTRKGSCHTDIFHNGDDIGPSNAPSTLEDRLIGSKMKNSDYNTGTIPNKFSSSPSSSSATSNTKYNSVYNDENSENCSDLSSDIYYSQQSIGDNNNNNKSSYDLIRDYGSDFDDDLSPPPKYINSVVEPCQDVRVIHKKQVQQLQNRSPDPSVSLKQIFCSSCSQTIIFTLEQHNTYNMRGSKEPAYCQNCRVPQYFRSSGKSFFTLSSFDFNDKLTEFIGDDSIAIDNHGSDAMNSVVKISPLESCNSDSDSGNSSGSNNTAIDVVNDDGDDDDDFSEDRNRPTCDMLRTAYAAQKDSKHWQTSRNDLANMMQQADPSSLSSLSSSISSISSSSFSFSSSSSFSFSTSSSSSLSTSSSVAASCSGAKLTNNLNKDLNASMQSYMFPEDSHLYDKCMMDLSPKERDTSLIPNPMRIATPIYVILVRAIKWMRILFKAASDVSWTKKQQAKMSRVINSGIFKEKQVVFARSFNNSNKADIDKATSTMFNLKCLNIGIFYSAGMSVSGNNTMMKAFSDTQTTTKESENLMSATASFPFGPEVADKYVPSCCKPLVYFIGQLKIYIKSLGLGLCCKVRIMFPGDSFNGHTDDMDSNSANFVNIRLVIVVNHQGLSASFICGEGLDQQTKITFESSVGGFVAMLSRHYLKHGPGFCDQGMRVALIFDGCHNMNEVHLLSNHIEDLLVTVGKKFSSIDDLALEITPYNSSNAVQFYLAVSAVQLEAVNEIDTTTVKNILARIYLQAKEYMMYTGSVDEFQVLYNSVKVNVSPVHKKRITDIITRRTKSVQQRNKLLAERKSQNVSNDKEDDVNVISKKSLTFKKRSEGDAKERLFHASSIVEEFDKLRDGKVVASNGFARTSTTTTTNITTSSLAILLLLF